MNRQILIEQIQQTRQTLESYWRYLNRPPPDATDLSPTFISPEEYRWMKLPESLESESNGVSSRVSESPRAWGSRATSGSGRNCCELRIAQASPPSERRSAFRSFFVFFFLSSSSHLAGVMLHHRSPVHMPSIFVPSASQTRTAFRTLGLGSSTACGGMSVSFKDRIANREALSQAWPPWHAPSEAINRPTITTNHRWKQIERCCFLSFRIAENMGFKGDLRQWRHLLRVGE